MTGRDKLIQTIASEAVEWRHAMHQNPQTMYEETYASDLVCRKLTEWGIPFERGIAKTGVVASIEGRNSHSGRAIAFRADMDALDIHEDSGQPWASRIPGKMHGCGHDGHTATVLTLARYLNETRNFDGVIRFIFQPAEEGGRGAFRMLEEGLLERFPFDEIYGFHNWPGIPRGAFAISSGPILAAVDEFEIRVEGKGGHAAMPELTRDVIPAMAQMVLAFQCLVSREADPTASAVVSVTNFNAGTGANNVISGSGVMTGTVRTFRQDLRDHIERRMKAVAQGIAASFEMRARVDYRRLIDPVINDEEATAHCREAAAVISSEGEVRDFQPMMGGEDFGGFLQVRPGAFIAVGQSEPDPSSPHNRSLHNPGYDFNDAIIPIAAGYFAELAERRLPAD